MVHLRFFIYYYYYRTYVGVCVTSPFFSFGVRCAQYKVHAQCSFTALAPHMPCMLLVHIMNHVLMSYIHIKLDPRFIIKEAGLSLRSEGIIHTAHYSTSYSPLSYPNSLSYVAKCTCTAKFTKQPYNHSTSQYDVHVRTYVAKCQGTYTYAFL